MPRGSNRVNTHGPQRGTLRSMVFSSYDTSQLEKIASNNGNDCSSPLHGHTHARTLASMHAHTPVRRIGWWQRRGMSPTFATRGFACGSHPAATALPWQVCCRDARQLKDVHMRWEINIFGVATAATARCVLDVTGAQVATRPPPVGTAASQARMCLSGSLKQKPAVMTRAYRVKACGQAHEEGRWSDVEATGTSGPAVSERRVSTPCEQPNGHQRRKTAECICGLCCFGPNAHDTERGTEKRTGRDRRDRRALQCYLYPSSRRRRSQTTSNRC